MGILAEYNNIYPSDYNISEWGNIETGIMLKRDILSSTYASFNITPFRLTNSHIMTVCLMNWIIVFVREDQIIERWIKGNQKAV